MKIKDKLLYIRIVQIIAGKLKIDKKEIKLNSVINDLVRSGEIGMMDIPGLHIALEEAFGVQIDEDNWAEPDFTVGKLYSLIAK